MSAVLRAYGADFNVDAFLVECALPVCAVKRRGEMVLPLSLPEGRRYVESAVHVAVSDVEFDDFPRQVEEATTFLEVEGEQIRRLSMFQGVESVTLDFGVARRDDALLQCNYLPPGLVRLAGSLGLGIEISLYCAGERETDS